MAIGERMMEVVPLIPFYQPIMPDDILSYLNDVLTHYQRAAQTDPENYAVSPEVLKELIAVCTSSPTQAKYSMAAKLVAMIENRLADPRLQANEYQYADAHVQRALAYMALAKAALAYQMDIDGFLRYWSLALAYKDRCGSGTWGTMFRDFDLEKKREGWPQPGWWNLGVDELQQPTLAELLADAQGSGEGEGDGAGEGRGDAEGGRRHCREQATGTDRTGCGRGDAGSRPEDQDDCAGGTGNVRAAFRGHGPLQLHRRRAHCAEEADRPAMGPASAGRRL
ncbi:MAG: hypothetical protein ACQER1_09550 [Armatimonadota bacterium]